MDINLVNRDKLISSIEEEIIGPVKNFSLAKGITRESGESESHPDEYYFYEHNGIKEEIITSGKPSRKYAAGLLYPSLTNNEVVDGRKDEEIDLLREENSNKAKYNQEEKEETIEQLKATNSYKESNMGFSFAINNEVKELEIRFDCGVYRGSNDFNVTLQKSSYSDKLSKWWFRESLKHNLTIDLMRHETLKTEILTLSDYKNKTDEEYKVKFYSNVRKVRLTNTDTYIKIVTLTVENISKKDDEEECILFQCNLEAKLNNGFYFIPYPKASEMEAKISDEDKQFEMLYLSENNFAFGHNCSTKWETKATDIDSISTTFLPEYEIKTMTPDIKNGNGEDIEVYHGDLVAAKTPSELTEILEPLIHGYERWFENLQVTKINSYYEVVKQKNLEYIQEAINRIRKGLNLLNNEHNFKCFKLANLAMLMQMNTGRTTREFKYSESNALIYDKEYYNPFENLDFKSIDDLSNSMKEIMTNTSDSLEFKYSKWRGFQIAFLLQSLDSIINKSSENRENVDLIWFPTGGGKTEAYLGVAAFSMLYRRSINHSDIGVDVLMRYTLRLLTADQFQRSSRLITSLEYIRRRLPNFLGDSEYSIGLWVGRQTTPNRLNGARKIMNDIKQGYKKEFIIEKCSWCGSELKVIENKHDEYIYEGFKFGRDLECYCPDEHCEFNEGLPIYFVDEMLYKNPPTFLIGTIDKFVQLSWNENVRGLFGIDNKGNRRNSPPNLIIQDELHLISGPLGSLTGIYEALVEDLCTDKREGNDFKPKILSATATIKNYDSQIQSIFGRKNSRLFPPSGLDINDNYFSTVRTDKKGEPFPGRKYLGVYTTTQGLLQSQVQTMVALLGKSTSFDYEDRDPFWTILSFYNSLNDIGKAKNLTEQDIPNNLEKYYKTRDIKYKNRRKLSSHKIKELTSRESHSKISRAISELAEPYKEKSNKAIDICLASNIIEVGIDIDRLSLMTIVGQPKTTAQYIQVSGRIGRKVEERPGLVVTIYNPSNSNDKSHFEHFNEYHQKLYSQVEENSVTPFSKFSLRRGVPAILVGFIRQNFDKHTLGKYPDRDKIEEIVDNIMTFFQKFKKRMELVDDSETEELQEIFEKLMKKLTEKEYESWEDRNGSIGFMSPIKNDGNHSFSDAEPVIFSMRNVDSSSLLKVSTKSTNDNKSASRFQL